MSPQYTNRLESSALLLSALCLLHCLALPLALAALPALSAVFRLPEALHLYVLLLALPLSLTALSFGMHSHRSPFPLVVGVFGLMLMGIALDAKNDVDEIILSSMGATILALAHISNWRRRSRCSARDGMQA